MAAEDRKVLMRHEIADYLKCGEAFELCGLGFTALSEEPGAETDESTYVNEKSSTTIIKGYKGKFPFEADRIESQKAVAYVVKIGEEQKTGEDAQTEYIRVNLKKPVSGSDGTYEARKFNVSVEVSKLDGEAGGKNTVSGNLNQMGDPVIGTFAVATKTFTEGNGKG